MGLKRPLQVEQRESEGEFWYVLKGSNGRVTSTSETYFQRANAVRAARKFIASIDPVPVAFTFWTGPSPAADPNGVVRRRQTVRIR